MENLFGIVILACMEAPFNISGGGWPFNTDDVVGVLRRSVIRIDRPVDPIELGCSSGPPNRMTFDLSCRS